MTLLAGLQVLMFAVAVGLALKHATTLLWGLRAWAAGAVQVAGWTPEQTETATRLALLTLLGDVTMYAAFAVALLP